MSENKIKNIQLARQVISLEPGSYSIYNALNLMNPILGERYLENGFNPFSADFKFDMRYIIFCLRNKQCEQEVVSPEFVEKGKKATETALNNCIKNLSLSIERIEELLNNPAIPLKLKEKLKALLFQLKMQLELARIFLERLRRNLDNQTLNTFDMYKDLLSINWRGYMFMHRCFHKDLMISDFINDLCEIAMDISSINNFEGTLNLDNMVNEMGDAQLSNSIKSNYIDYMSAEGLELDGEQLEQLSQYKNHTAYTYERPDYTPQQNQPQQNITDGISQDR